MEKTPMPITINPTTAAKSCIIFAHGLGASANDLTWLPNQLNLPESLGTRYIFPQAPTQPVSINAGMNMPSWFDIYRLDTSGQIDLAGLKNSRSMLSDLIKGAIADGIPAKKIIIAGFSQGGAVALFTGLTHPETLGGILGMSTFLTPMDKLAADFNLANQNTPILLTHGAADEVIPYQLGQATANELKQKQYPTMLKRYPIAHTISLDAIDDIRTWLLQILG